MSSLDRYTVIVTPDDPNYLACAPAIPGCYAIGASPEVARRELGHVFAMIVEEHAEQCRPLQPDVPDLLDVIEAQYSHPA